MASTLYSTKDIASQGKGSLLDGGESVKLDTLTNTVTSTYGITGNQSAKLFAQSSAKVSAGQSAKFYAGLKYETLSYPNPDIPNRGEITPFKGFIGVTARGDIEFCESIKKGSISATRFAQLSDCLALRCLRLISSRIAVTMNWASLSLSCFSSSIASSTSSGTLAVFWRDLLFNVPVAIICSLIFKWESLYPFLSNKKHLKCKSLNSKVQVTSIRLGSRTTKPYQCSNTNRASNHNVKRSNTMAMHKSTQTHPEFTWRFAECQENKATYHHVTAHTEDEARLLLPNLPLVFTARIRQEVAA